MNFTPHRAARLSSILVGLLTLNAAAGTLYVDINSASPVYPYSGWSTAATNIQDAVDAAAVGDEVVVTNGLYQTGGRIVYGAISNRVAVTKAITLRSVNGPGVTTIKGYQVPGTINGDAAVRCVYLTNGAILVGFTLTNGATRTLGRLDVIGGGVLCATNSLVLVSNCCLAGNAALSSGGGAYGGLLTGCTFSGNAANSGGGAAYATVQNGVFLSNTAFAGGGVYRCTLADCTLATNSARAAGGSADGGGAVFSTLSRCSLIGNIGSKGAGSFYGALYNCTLIGNSASDSGGGSYGDSLSNCSLQGNSAAWAGGGAYGCGTVSNCVFTGNTSLQGGAAALSTLNNCALIRNVATGSPGVGGGTISCTLNNCTLTGNSAAVSGGGVYSSTLNNCVIYYNSGGACPNYDNSTLNYCCALPLPPAGAGNIQAEPQLASAVYLSPASPCINAGSIAYTNGTDIDGEAWGSPPSIGCDEFHAGSATGAVTVAIQAASTNNNLGGSIAFTGIIDGRVAASRWDFGDGTSLSDQPYASHAWLTPGDYPVVLSAYNDSYPGGISTTTIVHVIAQSVYYVDLNSPGPAAPYSSWATAATNLQDAVDAAAPGGLILVTNGVYGVGGHVVYGSLTNRLAVTKPVTLQSINGPGVTVIQGSQLLGVTNGDAAVRCVYLTNGAGLIGFTLTNGATRTSGDNYRERSGGGVWCESATGATISNCVLAGNAASYSGGGAYQGLLSGCVLSNNWAPSSGGGAYQAWLTNCTLTRNVSTNGGGAYAGTLIRCYLFGNSAIAGGGINGSSVSQCTLTNNLASTGGGAQSARVTSCIFANNYATNGGGGAYAATLTDCALMGNSSPNGGGANGGGLLRCAVTNNIATSSGGGAYSAALTDCTLVGNSAATGGGACSATLNNCVLMSNLASSSGGGAYACTLAGCSLSGNSASSSGGGANGCSLTNCTLTSNTAPSGGGAYSSTNKNCTFTKNSANSGGGAYSCALTNCALIANTASVGGGASSCTLNNCTLTGNSATLNGGGTSGGTMVNCIIYYNQAAYDTNWSSGNFSYCCTAPLPGGTANITDEPQLSSVFHLSASSPCRGAGNAAVASGTDLDGESWSTPPAIGCDEFRAGNATGALNVGIQAAYTNVAVGFQIELTADIQGWVTASRWEFDDGTVLSNRPYASHAWSAPGDHTLTLRAYNDSNPSGVLAVAIIRVATPPVHYVSVAGGTAQAPYSSWATAARNVQDALDVAQMPGALVLVSNGTYSAGGRVVYGSLSNRVAVTVPVTVQSANGPEVTVIQGNQVPVTTNGDAAVRCVLLTKGAVLSGFTLVSGATRATGDSVLECSGGAVWCATPGVLVSNCVLVGNSAARGGGAAYSGALVDCRLTNNAAISGGAAFAASLYNCLLSTNSAQNGGGAYLGTLFNCTLSGNCASNGGGAYSANLTNCTLTSNSALGSGGGACFGSLTNCTLTSNRAALGGGSCSNSLINCVLSGNSAASGGGAYSATISNSALTGNTADHGGGVFSGTLNNCALTGNSGYYDGGGANSAALRNCIVYFNTAQSGSNWTGGSMTYCCSAPLPAGAGNIQSDPLLASTYHLSIGSPCRGAASAAYASGTDLDGEPWANPPSIGCDEFSVGAVSGVLSVNIRADYTNVLAQWADGFTADVAGRVAASWWEFGDGTIVSNRPYASHAWGAVGSYLVVLRAYNESNPGGISATVLVQVVSQPVHYVAQSSVGAAAPYDSWAKAATNIQDALDAAVVPGALVLVSNGVFSSGGRVAYSAMSNRVAVTRPLVLQSVNGPGVTWIKGYQVPGSTNGNSAVRCVYVTNGAWLVGFTLTNGATRAAGDADREQCGGGVWCEPAAGILNCVLTGNSAAIAGGGSQGGTLVNCTLIGNSAATGGGANSGTLNGCTITRNSAGSGGGTSSGVLSNCTVSGNSAAANGGGSQVGTLSYCTVTNNSAAAGGGVYQSAAGNCTISSNSATIHGGGACFATLNNCTLASNRSAVGGGAYYGTLTNCTVASNVAGYSGGGVDTATVYSSVLSQNSALELGGGANYGTIYNCTLSSNSVPGEWGYGGGAHGGSLTNCIVVGNWAGCEGGGAASARLCNCTLVGNSAAFDGGGAFGGVLQNSIIYYNSAPDSPDCMDAGALYCCTAGGSGGGTFGNPPLFVDLATGDFRLQSTSPCINSGRNAGVSVATDVAGNPRIVAGLVDIGAYEYQSPASSLPYIWLSQYGLATDGSPDTADPDQDGMNNWQEWRAGTNPTNALSFLQLLTPTNSSSGVRVTWQSVSGIQYSLQRSLDLSAQPSFVNVQSNIVGQAGTTTFTDTNAVGAGPFFYRVGVQ
jgi:hypothetical protein